MDKGDLETIVGAALLECIEKGYLMWDIGETKTHNGGDTKMDRNSHRCSCGEFKNLESPMCSKCFTDAARLGTLGTIVEEVLEEDAETHKGNKEVYKKEIG